MFMTDREYSLNLDACNFLLHQPPYANSVEEIEAYIRLFQEENNLVDARPEIIRQKMIAMRLKAVASELARERERAIAPAMVEAIGPYAALNEILSIAEFKEFLDTMIKAYYKDPRVFAWCKNSAGAWQTTQPFLQVLGRYMADHAKRLWNEVYEQEKV